MNKNNNKMWLGVGRVMRDENISQIEMSCCKLINPTLLLVGNPNPGQNILKMRAMSHKIKVKNKKSYTRSV